MAQIEVEVIMPRLVRQDADKFGVELKTIGAGEAGRTRVRLKGEPDKLLDLVELHCTIETMEWAIDALG